jgi:phosphoribosylformylglycinamidine cyclo-ligase/phosphoribosylamine--glycine ligase/phosphoribosylformylglycinamidine cyclo-ligase
MENKMAKQKPGYVKTKYDDLTYKLNGLAMQTHNELKPGHKEKFYQRRLAELCREAGLEVEVEKMVEVWVGEQLVGYMYLDLWVENHLVVECKAFSHQLTNDEVSQCISYLAATGSEVGLLFNFGRPALEFRRIFPPSQVQDWQKSLHRAVMPKPGFSLPSLDTAESSEPIRFVVQGTERVLEIPIRSSVDHPLPSSVYPLQSTDNIRSSAPHPLKKSAYADSGVDIDAGNRAVELMKDAVKSTYTPAVLAGIGSFGGLFDASALKQMQNPVLVASTDGVGTKVKLAASVGRYRGIGHDIVNHCIDDILVQGARPLFFMDYFATSKLNPEQTAEVVTGIAEACKESGMALLGGETAEMPGVYAPGEFDVAGTVVGVLERDRILPRTAELKAGDVLIGLRSSGPHTNGYSLIRKVFADVPLDTVFPQLGIPLTDALLAPHRAYLNTLHPVLSSLHLKALAHLTGGGFIENIPRVLPADLDAVIQPGSWPVPPLWSLIQQKGNIATEEMYRVFNMGIGMVAIAEADVVAELQSLIPEETWVIGKLVSGSRQVTFNQI